MVEDGRTILRADVATLPIERGWVVDGEEDVEKIAVRDRTRVEGDLDDLGMSGSAGAHPLVRRVHRCAACITRLDLLDAAQVPIDRVQAPEAAASERRDFAGPAVDG